MSRFTDRLYLRGQQYKTPANLEARISLHRRFSVNPYRWFQWAYDQLDLQPDLTVLEVGCGPGDLWLENRARLPQGLHAVLGDLSGGMAAHSSQALAGLPGFSFLSLDAQALPLPGRSFNRIVANHMLYHVPDLPRALAEFVRVLQPAGCLVAATNSKENMHELFELIREVKPDYAGPDRNILGFTLENAAQVLSPFFPRIEVRHYPDELLVTEAAPLLDYILSMGSLKGSLDQNAKASLVRLIRAKIDAGGVFRITKSLGLVVAGLG